MSNTVFAYGRSVVSEVKVPVRAQIDVNGRAAKASVYDEDAVFSNCCCSDQKA